MAKRSKTIKRVAWRLNFLNWFPYKEKVSDRFIEIEIDNNYNVSDRFIAFC